MVADEELMKDYQDGSEEAFAELYRRHSGKVYGFLRNRLGGSPLVDDIFQATFMKLHKARSHYDPSFPFVPWLFTVTRSVMVDGLRKQARIHEEHDDEAIAAAAAAPVASDDPKPVLPSLKGLPAAQRSAVQLRYGDELSFEEIALRLETSPANVRQLVSRALKRLRKGV